MPEFEEELRGGDTYRVELTLLPAEVRAESVLEEYPVDPALERELLPDERLDELRELDEPLDDEPDRDELEP